MKKISIVFALLMETGYVLTFGVPEVIEKTANTVFTNSCIEDLGCFYTGPPFYDKMLRPASVPPCVPSVIFKLYTPSNPTDSYDLDIDLDSVESSAFNPHIPLIFLLPGFISQLEPANIIHVQRESILKHGNYNVILVDWKKDNLPPYEQAVANIRSVGAKVANLINFLIDNSEISAEDVHLIGHSLGAHMAGHIGERVPNLGKITGLDPAKPYFFGLEHEHEVILDPSDALFVQVIHTDIVQGSESPVGHVDIYVNGGWAQPKCITSVDENSFNQPESDVTKDMNFDCNHMSVNEYFIHSIDNSECQFLAVKCNSYKNFKAGLCPPEENVVIEMGFHTQPITDLDFPAKFFLNTTGIAPYCIKSDFKI